MAFIRDYGRMSGDPFRLRIPKRWRKAKWGKGFAKIARVASPLASFVPGLGQAVDFARGYGLMEGDPVSKVSKHGSAAMGPQHKAKMKAQKRHERATGQHIPGHVKRRGGGNSNSKGHAKRGRIDWSKVSDTIHTGVQIGSRYLPGPSGATKEPGGFSDDQLNDIIRSGGGVPAHVKRALGMHGGGHSRRMNPANVKALRRGIRRVEGFQKLAKSVFKAFPAMKHGAGMAPAHRGGHKAGCRCVACKHK